MLSYRYSYTIKKLDNIKLLACDYTEEELLDYRTEQYETGNSEDYCVERNPEDEIKKIGFLSRDFHTIRPSGQLCHSFFKILSKYKNYFEIHFFTTLNDHIDEEYTKFGITHKVHRNNLADTIHKTNIDVLFDMQGCMENNFIDILKSKPAPVQVHFIGYPGTLGVSNVDFLIADKTVIPFSSTKYYRENIAYMPNCYQVNNADYLVRYSTFNTLALKIPKNSFIMCCVNSTYKINRSIVLIWLRLLKNIKNAIFVIVINKILIFKITSCKMQKK